VTSVTFESLQLPTNADRGRIALACASLGWRVLPIRATDKRPAMRSWPTLATSDRDTILEWWDANGDFPHCNVGVATGRESGVWVLDVDPEGFESLRRLLAEHGETELPRTFTVRTPRGGAHLYFSYATDGREVATKANTLGDDYPGIDTRGWHGQVLAPTTRLVTASGLGEYAVADTAAPVDAPGWLVSLVEKKPHEGPAIDPDLARELARANDSLAGRLGAYARMALETEVAELTATARGGRNDRLNRVAFALGGLGAYGLLDVREVYAALCDACERNGLLTDKGQRAFDATFRSGWFDGLEAPRELPPNLSEELTPAPPVTKDTAGVKLASEFEVKPVRWLWSGRIPLGKITMHDGDPGRGKSLTYVSIAGQVTRGKPLLGEVPAGQEPRGVVICCAEDDWEDTIVPRLIAAGADLDLVATVLLDRDGRGNVRPLTVPDDLGRVRFAVERVNAALVVIDPIMAYLGQKTNSNNDSYVRQALAPLKEFAEELGVAVLLVRHLNKNGDLKAEYRGGGSIGFTAQARSALISEFHPTEDGALVLAQLKSSLAAKSPSLKYRIDPAVIEANGVRVRTAAIRWLEVVELTAEDLLRPRDGRKQAPDQTACWELMQRLFAERDRWPSKEMAGLLKEEGYSESTIKRVRQARNVASHRATDEAGRTTGWDWVKPSQGALEIVNPWAGEGEA
jgi:hypothetical protein